MSKPRLRLPDDSYDLMFMTAIITCSMLLCTFWVTHEQRRTNELLDTQIQWMLEPEVSYSDTTVLPHPAINFGAMDLCEKCTTDCRYVPCDDPTLEEGTPVQWREGTFVRDKDHYTKASFKELQLAMAHLENEQGAVRGDIAHLRERMSSHNHNLNPWDRKPLGPRTQ